MTLSSRFSAGIVFTQTKAADGGQARAELALQLSKVLVDGTANGQANIGFRDDRTLATGANEDIDLVGVLQDVYGATLSAVEIQALGFVTAPGNTTNLTIKPATTNGFLGPFSAAASAIVLGADACAMFFAPPAGWPVTAGTADLINIANAAGASATYGIAILGRNA